VIAGLNVYVETAVLLQNILIPTDRHFIQQTVAKIKSTSQMTGAFSAP
jgi:hypothetical protein